MSRPEAVSISGFRADGWLSGVGDAALVRVLGGPAQVLVTVSDDGAGLDAARIRAKAEDHGLIAPGAPCGGWGRPLSAESGR